MTAFNSKAARAKRPCPIWVDAFQRDTQHLEADEIGAYFLILMAMWTRESCDFPDDDNRLARVSRVSSRLWKSRIGPVLREFLTADSGVVFSKRLRQEATYVERQVKQQSDRKTGEKSDNYLNNNEPGSTADTSADATAAPSFLQPNNPTLDGGGSSAGAYEPQGLALRERVLAAMGVRPDGVIGPSRFIGGAGDMSELRRWLDLPNLTPDVICAEVTRVISGKRDGPPKSFTYFTEAMCRLSGQLSAPPLEPTTGTSSDRPAPRDRRTASADDAFAERTAFAARNRSPTRSDFGFG